MVEATILYFDYVNHCFFQCTINFRGVYNKKLIQNSNIILGYFKDRFSSFPNKRKVKFCNFCRTVKKITVNTES